MTRSSLLGGAFQRGLSRLSVCSAFVVFIGIVATQATLACLWTYGTDAHGHANEVTDDPAEYIERLAGNPHDLLERRNRHRDTLAEEVKQGGNYWSQNAYAVALIRVGEHDKAHDILNRLEKEHPGMYGTAANIGTLYELRGNDVEALKWIQEGIRRNKDAHFGTEWLHAKILEAKLAIAKDPTWLKSNTVSDLSSVMTLLPPDQFN
jgi:hypothetical protein